MKILVISAFFPPNVIGGAEMSAWNLAKWLRDHGHEVAVLTSAKSPEQVAAGVVEDGLKVWRLQTPHIYPIANFQDVRGWRKAVWHLQDHLDPRSRGLFKQVYEAFRPEFVNIHGIQGLGYTILKEIAANDLPTMYVLPDLGLACVRMSMFKGGQNCLRQCVTCKLSSAYKRELVGQVPRLGYVSPSAYNLRRLQQYFPTGGRSAAVRLNANRYPAAQIANTPRDGLKLKLIYVGRVHASKGVHTLIDACERVAAENTIELTVVGGGPELDSLRSKYTHAPWLRFTGQVPQQEVSNLMAASDLLCIPSNWAENSPGVVIQALSLGIPVLGSDMGGIPELVEAGVNGYLVEPGQPVAWSEAIARLVADPATLRRLKVGARSSAQKYDPEVLGHALFSEMSSILKAATKSSPPSHLQQ